MHCVKIFAAVILIGSFMANVSCHSWHDFSIQTAEPLSATPFEPQKTYEIVFTNGATIAAKGNDLLLRGANVGVRPEGQSDFVFYGRDQIQNIRVREFSSGKTTGLVLGILGGIGAIIGGSIAVIHSACSTKNVCD